jgi:seryl-tRNA synthetase
MPLDIALLRNSPEVVKESQVRRFKDPAVVDQVLELDVAWKTALGEMEAAKQERNDVQKQVQAKMKAKEKCPELIAKIGAFKTSIKALEDAVAPAAAARDRLLMTIGNIVDDECPVSQDEEKDCIVRSTFGPTPKGAGFLHHHEVLYRIGGYEPEAGSKVAGHRAYFLTDMGLLLNQALINYGLAFLRARENPYKIMQPPYFMNKDIMAGVAQLEQFDEELYHVKVRRSLLLLLLLLLLPLPPPLPPPLRA